MQTPKVDSEARFAERYALLERLHVGSATEVWLARDERADIAVALKILNARPSEKRLQRQMFEREYKIARSLNHQHTVRALGWHEGERAAYAMQYIDGTDFADLVGVDPEVWLPAILVIIDTLDYWHRKGVVHGDIKPANCLVDRRGAAYLADFGTAAIVDDDHDERRGGTSAYSSPEQQAGQSPHPADDVFAIGRVITELAAGAPDAVLPVSFAPAIVAALQRTQVTREQRLTAAQLRDAFAQAGVVRDRIDLGSLRIKLRRPAASVAGNTGRPVEAIPHGAFERVASARSEAKEGVSLQWVLAGLLLIVVLGVAVTYGVSRLRGDDVAAQTQLPETPVVAPPENDAVAAAAAATDASSKPSGSRASADALVSELIALQSRLEARGVAVWGGVTLQTALERYAQGDRAYLAADFVVAVTRYEEAIDDLQLLEAGIEKRFEAAMREADAAMRNEDANGARAAYQLALAITPDDRVATRGLERAANLDAVLAKMAEGRVAERAGTLARALASYREALSLDAEWQPAIESRDRVRSLIANDAFNSDMSRGLQAMEQNDFAAARAAFNAAGKLRPGDPAPRDALLQLRISERLERISGLQQQARTAEAAENWRLAKTRYNEMLEIDGSLDIAREGVVRTAEREALMADLAAVLRNPDTLSETDALREASALLTVASDVQPRGSQLAARIDGVTRLLTQVAVPLPVELRSDGQTSVTLLKVERLGVFEVTEVRLRPGLYTVVGTRRGYVDARQQFRVKPGESVAPVYIACEQPI